MCTSAHGSMNDGSSVAAPAADRGAAGPAADPALVADLVLANRILFSEGVLDAFGHVSVRHDKRADRFLLARNMAPALVKAEDIVEFDADGEPVNAAGRPVYLERFIHSEIYRARPDVMAVVHSHSMAVLPFGLVKSQPFRAVTHMGSFIGVCAPVFEIRDVVGDDNDLLITNRTLGAALARTLGQGTVALMRGHGSTAVGNSLKQAVFRAVYTEQNARVLSEALRIGPVEGLSEAETRTATRTIDTQVDRAWNMWRLRAEGKV
ncbi:MAG TPA: class II aldolase/adducin family protein [Beijerinckiaceae bacterium]